MIPILILMMTLNLLNIWNIKYLINGTILKEELKLNNGPIIGQLLEHQLKWIIENPNKGYNECIIYMKSMRDILL